MGGSSDWLMFQSVPVWSIRDCLASLTAAAVSAPGHRFQMRCNLVFSPKSPESSSPSDVLEDEVDDTEVSPELEELFFFLLFLPFPSLFAFRRIFFRLSGLGSSPRGAEDIL